jgi:hypothetical protein
LTDPDKDAYSLDGEKLCRKVDGMLVPYVPEAVRKDFVSYYHREYGHFSTLALNGVCRGSSHDICREDHPDPISKREETSISTLGILDIGAFGAAFTCLHDFLYRRRQRPWIPIGSEQHPPSQGCTSEEGSDKEDILFDVELAVPLGFAVFDMAVRRRHNRMEYRRSNPSQSTNRLRFRPLFHLQEGAHGTTAPTQC